MTFQLSVASDENNALYVRKANINYDIEHSISFKHYAIQ